MTRITIEPMERSLPVYDADYRSERIASFRLEDDLAAGWKVDGILSFVAQMRAAQLADLDAQEATLRERFDMPVPAKPGERAARIEAARKAQGLPPATSPAANAPAPSIQPVQASERKAASAAPIHPNQKAPPEAAPSRPPPASVPATDVTTARAMPGPTTWTTPDGRTFRPGAQVAAGERRCSDQDHGSKPAAIPSIDWDTSHRIYGRALCQAHMAARRRMA